MSKFDLTKRCLVLTVLLSFSSSCVFANRFLVALRKTCSLAAAAVAGGAVGKELEKRRLDRLGYVDPAIVCQLRDKSSKLQDNSSLRDGQVSARDRQIDSLTAEIKRLERVERLKEADSAQDGSGGSWFGWVPSMSSLKFWGEGSKEQEPTDS